MLTILMKLLPADKRAMIELAMRMVAKLNTPAERQAVAEYGIAAFKDGSISITEWATIGGKMGILTGPKKNGK
tara:strand:- start:219 stop:437 length:219 start_codon:yes stop_codon:yes gene_type:complete